LLVVQSVVCTIWCSIQCVCYFLCGLASGWPDWANFRPLSDCVFCIVFVKITEVASIIGLLFSAVKVL
jgi:hypothetical protein